MKKILLTQGQFAIVDDEDFEELNKFKWHARKDTKSGDFYSCRNKRVNIDKKYVQMHRQVMEYPKGKMIDHRNHNTLDNRKCNLRVCTNSQNQMNAKLSKTNKSGVTGVYFSKKVKKWVAQIRADKKQKYVGIFTDKDDAIKARKEAEEKYFKTFAFKQGG